MPISSFPGHKENFLLMLQCDVEELRGAGRVLSVLRISASERNRQVQVLGRRLGGLVGALCSAEILLGELSLW